LPEEFDFHVHEGRNIKAPYQVGVLTANECYVIDASWFRNNFESTLANYSRGAPAGAKLVDDIWINGHLAALGIERFIVPMSGLSIDIAQIKTLDEKMKLKGISRAVANGKTLSWFKDAFRSERIPYLFGGVEQPEKRSWLASKIMFPVRHWLLRGWINFNI
jgi:hypothetical protein